MEFARLFKMNCDPFSINPTKLFLKHSSCYISLKFSLAVVHLAHPAPQMFARRPASNLSRDEPHKRRVGLGLFENRQALVGHRDRLHLQPTFLISTSGKLAQLFGVRLCPLASSLGSPRSSSRRSRRLFRKIRPMTA